jgi:hypothetical protein
MKKVLLIILASVLAHGLNAQLRCEMKAGGTVSNFSMKEKGASRGSNIKIGLEIGGILEYSFSRSFALQPELLYVNNGGKFESDFFDDDMSFNLHQLQLPVNLKYRLGGTKMRKFYAIAGPYLGYIVSAREKVGAVTMNALKKGLLGIQLNRFDFGIGLGLGIEISNKYLVAAGYKHGIANLTKAEGVNLKARIFNLSLGYLF